MAESPAVRVTDIHHAFGPVQAVRGVSFDVAESEFLVLLGPSGSGKTTILRIIAGFEDLTRGSVAIRGREVAEVPPNKRDIGVVFQHFALFPHLTVFGNVAFGLEMRRSRATSCASASPRHCRWCAWSGSTTGCPASCRGGSSSVSLSPERS